MNAGMLGEKGARRALLLAVQEGGCWAALAGQCRGDMVERQLEVGGRRHVFIPT